VAQTFIGEFGAEEAETCSGEDFAETGAVLHAVDGEGSAIV
jgi:hypothetical protein